MGLINQVSEIKNPVSESNYFVYIMKDLIKEFNKVGADCILPNERLNQVSNFINEMAIEGYLIFSFEKEEYFSDIIKTAELVVEDFARKLVRGSKAFREKAERNIAIANFRMCFKPYCIEKTVEKDFPREKVAEVVLEELKETISKGRGIPMATKPSIVELLTNEDFQMN
ncbi:hypothetical protein BFP97_09545 [Roseivirga sp. 4D4]|nr:hypothetical protein BFP97_09545 [Roseivirga sp. 4D4]